MTGLLIRTRDEITPDWLAKALGLADVGDLTVDPIGTGQMSRNLRVGYRVSGGSGVEHIVVKIASDDPNSRATGVGLGAYAKEVCFYREFGSRAAGSVPTCRLAEYDEAEGWFTLLLDDLHPAQAGDQITGCAPDVAERALIALARVQGPVLGDPELAVAPWLNTPSPLSPQLYDQVSPLFLERYADRVTPEHAEVVRRFGTVLAAWGADREEPLGLAHGDFRLDNLLFDDQRCAIVDWQTVGWGPVLRDVAYLLGASLLTDDRRAHEDRLVRAYHRELVAAGGQGLDWERCWADYVSQSLYGVLMTVCASMVVERTPRGDDMFMAMLERHAQHALDVGALDGR
jgi:hypothetical protein